MSKNHTFIFITAVYSFVFFAGQSTYAADIPIAPGEYKTGSLAAAAYIPIAPGEYKPGSLAGGQMHTYSFDASAGDSVTILMGQSSHVYDYGDKFDPRVELHAPDGTVLAVKSGDYSAYIQSVKVPKSGTCFIIAREKDGFDAGDYGLSLVKNPGKVTVNDPNGGPIEPGEYKSGRIEPGDIDAYTFTASAGDSVTILMGQSSHAYDYGDKFDPRVELHAPDGTVLDVNSGGYSANIQSVRVPQSGTYFIIAREKDGCDAGDYGLSLVKIPGTVTVNDSNGGPIEPGEYKRGRIEPGDIDAYTFTASAGDSVTIIMSQLSHVYDYGETFEPRIELHAPDGTVLDVNSGSDSATFQSVKVPQSGKYFIIAREKDGLDAEDYGLSFSGPSPVPPGDLNEVSSTEAILVETVYAEQWTLRDGNVVGDMNGIFALNDFELVTIGTGSWTGKGFSKALCEATLEGATYRGEWQGIAFFDPNTTKIRLKGSIMGEILAAVEGTLTESVPGSGVYDHYEATWKIGRLDNTVTSATVRVTGVLINRNRIKYPSTGLYICVLQTAMDGELAGDFKGPLSTVISQVRIIADLKNPYNGSGFSVISYVCQSGSGEGYTCDQPTSPGVLTMRGMFTGPLYGVLSATLNETTSPRVLHLFLQRVDLGLPPAPDVRVEIIAPQRMSPGETINYVVNYVNKGLKPVDTLLASLSLDPNLEYFRASNGSHYSEVANTVGWTLGQISPGGHGCLIVQAKLPWGLPDGLQVYVRSSIVAKEKTEQGLAPVSSTKTPGCFKALLLNGIDLVPATDYWEKLDKLAKEMGAIWPPIYFGNVGKPGKGFLDAWQVDYATPGTNFRPTDENGLTNPLITQHCYDIVIAYSGGTRTALTAIERYNLRTKTLVLISPMSGLQGMGAFKQELEQILRDGKVEEIVIYQSDRDYVVGKPIDWLFHARFGPGDASWFNTWIDTPSGKKRIGDVVKVNPPIQDIDGIQLEIDPEAINQQGHGGLFDYLYERLISKLPNPHDSDQTTGTVTTARDPNRKLGPAGNVLPGQKLDYSVEYENEGEGIAFGVYFTDTLDEDVKDATLEIGPVIDVKTHQQIAPPGIYIPATRTIIWFVGQVDPNRGGYADVRVNVKSDAADGTEIINFATVYFPSVPEATRTNAVVSIVSTAPPNHAPVVAAGSDATIGKGQLFSRIGSFVDPDVGDSWSATVDYGDGSGQQSLALDGRTYTLSHTYMASGVYHVTVTVTDRLRQSGVGRFTVTVTVPNIAPVVDAGSDVAIGKGQPLSRVGSFADPDVDDSWSATVDYGDGSGQQSLALDGKTCTLSHTYTASGTYHVIVTVTDRSGQSGVGRFTVTVTPIPPVVSASILSQDVQYSDPIKKVVFVAAKGSAETMHAAVAYSTDGGKTFSTKMTSPPMLVPPDDKTIAGGLAFTGDIVQVGSATWTLDGVADLAPGSYIIRLTVRDEDDGSAVDTTINVLQEDAFALYAGAKSVPTPSASENVANVELLAVILDITAVNPASDSEAGNITKALVTFVNRDSGAVIAERIPVELWGPYLTVGIASYKCAVDLGSQNSASFTIGIIVDGYYARNSSADNTVVTVSRPVQR